MIGQVKCVTDEREREKRQSAERENRGDGERRILVVGFDCTFRGNDGADAANRGANGEKCRQLGLQIEEAAQQCHEGDGESDFYQNEGKSWDAEFPNVTE